MQEIWLEHMRNAMEEHRDLHQIEMAGNRQPQPNSGDEDLTNTMTNNHFNGGGGGGNGGSRPIVCYKCN